MICNYKIDGENKDFCLEKEKKLKGNIELIKVYHPINVLFNIKAVLMF